MSYFPLVSPDSVHISSDGIQAFLDAADRSGLELHRLMILRHGKCCAKTTWLPYQENDLHPLYSFSKSFTATAIAFACQEGLLTLNDRIADIFPEDLPQQPSENLLDCEIRHLLSMSCGHETECRDNSPAWRKSFLAHPFVHKPGTFFLYNSAGTNLLAAIIRKKTGLQVTEYLRSRLFDPLGMGKITCAQLPDDLRTQLGGGGMKASLEDMAKFTQFMLQDGIWEGKALLPGWYLAKAGKKQIETAGDSEGHIKDWALGYGYQCWMCSLEDSFRADGAFGQFGLVYPTLDLAVIINAATEQTQTLLDAVNQHLLPAVAADNEKTDALSNGSISPAAADDRPFCPASALPALKACRNPRFEETLNHTVFYADQIDSMCSLKTLVGGAGLFEPAEDNAVSQIRFVFSSDRVTLLLTEGSRLLQLDAALDNRFLYSLIDGYTYAATARWRSLRRLELEIRRMDAMSGVRLILSFENDQLLFEADETLMTDGGLGMTQRRLSTFGTRAVPDFRSACVP